MEEDLIIPRCLYATCLSNIAFQRRERKLSEDETVVGSTNTYIAYPDVSCYVVGDRQQNNQSFCNLKMNTSINNASLFPDRRLKLDYCMSYVIYKKEEELAGDAYLYSMYQITNLIKNKEGLSISHSFICLSSSWQYQQQQQCGGREQHKLVICITSFKMKIYQLQMVEWKQRIWRRFGITFRYMMLVCEIPIPISVHPSCIPLFYEIFFISSEGV